MAWRTIPNWPKYKINSNGEIVGQRNKKLRPAISSWGYKTVVLCDNNFRKTMKVHRLVAEAFIPNPHNKETVNHKNGNKLDNRVCNLEWATVAEQQIHRSRVLGFGTKAATMSLRKPIKCLETGEIFESIKVAAKKYNGDYGRLSQAAKLNKPWHNLHWILISKKEVKWG